MAIRAKIVADSVNTSGCRLTTVEATYPRIIHEEVLTHRMLSADPQAWAELSRNSASSRAIPTHLWISDVSSNPFIPVWVENRSGMVGGTALSSEHARKATEIWLEFRDAAVSAVMKLSALGVHKHHANRPLHALQHITTVISATEWDNFFGLRFNDAAAPEFIELAGTIYDLYTNSAPKLRQRGDWHLPYIDDEERTLYTAAEAIKRSVARCGRVSYLRQGDKGDFKTELDRADSFVSMGHWSATEHAASALDTDEQFGNFKGWVQYRKYFPNETVAQLIPPSTWRKQ